MVITRLGARTRSARLEILSFSGVAPPSAWRPALISPALRLDPFLTPYGQTSPLTRRPATRFR